MSWDGLKDESMAVVVNIDQNGVQRSYLKGLNPPGCSTQFCDGAWESAAHNEPGQSSRVRSFSSTYTSSSSRALYDALNYGLKGNNKRHTWGKDSHPSKPHLPSTSRAPFDNGSATLGDKELLAYAGVSLRLQSIM